MPEYTSLKGFESISQTDLQTVIESNLIAFFDWGFLDKGAFSNVSMSQIDIRGSNRSTLQKVNDVNYGSNRVYATFHQNLVWESGLTTSSQPISISGVYVNGSFKTPTTSGFQHRIDYPNGLVIFDTARPNNAEIKMAFSYKNFLITKAEAVPILKEVQTRAFDLTAPGYSSTSSGDWSRDPQARVQMPIVAIEVSPRVTLEPTELGNTAHWCKTDVLCHVFAENDEMVKKLSWVLASQKEKTIFLYDVDMAVESGVLPLNERGSYVPGGLTYPDLIESYKYNKLFFADASIQGPYRLGNVYHGIVRFKTEVMTTS